FSKMHGLGNDFVIVDCREAPLALDASAIAQLGDRHIGVGFDQLLTIENASDPSCVFAYGIWNSNGSRAGQCGNGLRCVARWLAREGLLSTGSIRLESPSGPIAVEVMDDGSIRADMGEPDFTPAAIPLLAAGRGDPYTIEVVGEPVDIGAVSMGNPHAVIEIGDADAAPVSVLGPQIEHADAFPRGCNVGFAQVVSPALIRLRVWERGAGETLACGSGACAAVAVLRRRAKLDASVRVLLPGGALDIHWEGPGHAMWMRGPATFVFDGEYELTGSASTRPA
ncbi:MAG: diaminopimelate epimerase, partial [Dokdonella sp.]|uniref:diaminopimelate epimerase n=1 Tax=Dokdonella sp. TaxID=2291710 RepID=UPI0032639C7F